MTYDEMHLIWTCADTTLKVAERLVENRKGEDMELNSVYFLVKNVCNICKSKLEEKGREEHGEDES